MSMIYSNVQKKGNYYEVAGPDYSGSRICIAASRVEKIVNQMPWEVNDAEVAILLATAQRQMHGNMTYGVMHKELVKNRHYQKVDEEQEEQAIVKLLGHFDVAELISIFEELKYCEIQKVYESNNPVKTIREQMYHL